MSQDRLRIKGSPTQEVYLDGVRLAGDRLLAGPTEHSSGDSRSQGSITKTGNTHARRLLVERTQPSNRKTMSRVARQHNSSGADPATPLTSTTSISATCRPVWGGSAVADSPG